MSGLETPRPESGSVPDERPGASAAGARFRFPMSGSETPRPEPGSG